MSAKTERIAYWLRWRRTEMSKKQRNFFRCVTDWAYSEACVKGVVLEARREFYENGEFHLEFNIDGRLVRAPSVFFDEAQQGGN